MQSIKGLSFEVQKYVGPDSSVINPIVVFDEKTTNLSLDLSHQEVYKDNKNVTLKVKIFDPAENYEEQTIDI